LRAPLPLGQRAILLVSLALLSALAWLRLFYLDRSMSGMSMDGMTMEEMGPGRGGTTPTDLLLTFAMWMVMMIAMMLPSAAPVVLLFAEGRSRERGRPMVDTTVALFVLGYLLVWAGFSLAAALTQGALRSAALLSPELTLTGRLGVVILVAAGLYQLSPLKAACLRHCQSPLGYLWSHWREGRLGALFMGARHGWYCLGCCWLLMALLFVTGVMNLAWVAALAGFVLVEKYLAVGRWFSWAGGIALIAAAIALALRQ
jgi:predicted metal-binding membrane protein